MIRPLILLALTVCCLGVVAHFVRLAVIEIRNSPSWRYSTEVATDIEHMSELAEIGDLRELMLRLRTGEESTTDTAFKLTDRARNHGMILTADKLLELTGFGTTATPATVMVEHAGLVNRLLKRVRSGELISFQEVFLLDQWLHGVDPVAAEWNLPELEKIFGTTHHDKLSSRDETTITYKLAEWSREGGGSTVGIEYVREYYVSFALKGTPGVLQGWEITRRRYRNIEYGID